MEGGRELNTHLFMKKYLIMIMSLILVCGTSILSMNDLYALSLTMNARNYLKGVTNKKGAKLNDGSVLDESTYDGYTVLMSMKGQFFYCLQHGKQVSTHTKYSSEDAETLIKKASKNKKLTVKEKELLISRVLSLAPVKFNSDFSTDDPTPVKGNSYQWLAAQIIVWEIMAGERDEDGNRVAVKKGITATRNAFTWSDKAVKKKVMNYYNTYSDQLISWGKIPSFTAETKKDAKSYALKADTKALSLNLTDTNNVLTDFSFKGSNLTFTKKDNVLTVKASKVFTSTVTVEATNELESKKKQLICVDGGEEYQIGAVTGKTEATTPNAFFKVNVSLGNIDLVKTDSKGGVLPDAEFDVTGPVSYKKHVVVDDKGEIHLTNLVAGTYTFTETKAPEGYLVVEPFKLNVTNKKTTKKTVVDEEPTGSIVVMKEDSEGHCQGEASLKDAIYSVRNSDGEEVATLTTDEKGHASIDNLPLGDYTVQETKAPDGYLIDPEVYNVSLSYGGQTQKVISQTITSKEDVKMGRIKVIKQNTSHHKVTYKPAAFGIYADVDMYIGDVLYKKGQLIETIKTVDGECISLPLPYGHYIVREVDAPDGFLVNVKDEEVALLEDGAEDEVTFINEEKRGSITITKSLSRTVTGMTGDATVKGASYALYATEDIIDPATGEVIYEKGKEVSVKETDEKGVVTWSDLYLGHYEVKETKASEGCLLDTDSYPFILKEEKPDQKETISLSKKVKEDVKQRTILIKKLAVFDDGLMTHLKGLNGAGFEIKLKSDVQKLGYEKALLYDSVKTVSKDNEDGYAITRALPYGTYIIRETITPEGYEPISDHEFKVTKDNVLTEGESQTLELKNNRISGYAAIVKIDAETGKTVSLHGAKFKIKDSKTGEYISQKVGSKTYDTFITNSLDRILPDAGYLNTLDQLGMVVTPLKLEYGTYEVEEVEAPLHYTLAKKSVAFTVDEKTPVNDHGDKLISVTFKDSRIKGCLELTKTIEKTEADTSFIDHQDYNDIQFTLKADEDIEDPADGEVIYKKGDEVGHYILDKSGHLTVDDLYLGHYSLEETTTKPGLSSLSNKISFVITDTNSNLPRVIKELSITNIPTQVSFSKTSITSEGELEGALLRLEDSEGNVVDEWTSTDKPHVIEGLSKGQTYHLHEEAAPNGYMKASDVIFKVEDTGEIQKFNMVDKLVSISKTDVTGTKELEGAKLTVTDSEGNTVDSWTSTAETHYVNGLTEGDTYTLTEETSPNGYVCAESITFTAGESDHIVMKDKQVTISKTDITNGKELEGAKLVVKDEEGNVVDEWVSEKEKHYVNSLVEGKTYTLTEVTAPYGYDIAETITFTVTNDKVNQHIDMKDAPILTTIHILKKDKHAKKLITNNNFSFGLYKDEKCKELIKEVKGDKNGKATFNKLPYGIYYIKETKEPKGYKISKEVLHIIIDERSDRTLTYDYYDEKTPIIITKTGDHTIILPYIIMALASLLALILYRKKVLED